MSAPKPPGLVAVATVTFKRAGEWTPERRKEVAVWLRQHAKDLVKDGPNYSRRFTGRFLRKP